MSGRPSSQPRLSGNAREPRGTSVPPHVTKALREIALRENKSMAWVTAEIVYDYLGLDETGWFAKHERKRA